MVRQVSIRRHTHRSLGLAACLAATMLAGCGRKGPLELPPGAPETPSTAAASDTQQARVLPAEPNPGLIQPPTTPPLQRSAAAKLKAQVAAPPPPINGADAKPGKPFILDPLL